MNPASAEFMRKAGLLAIEAYVFCKDGKPSKKRASGTRSTKLSSVATACSLAGSRFVRRYPISIRIRQRQKLDEQQGHTWKSEGRFLRKMERSAKATFEAIAILFNFITTSKAYI